MKTVFVLILAIAGVSSFDSRKLYIRGRMPVVTPLVPARAPRITGGEAIAITDAPWQVALFIDYIYFCGGSIINSTYVLTAAHCLDGSTNVEVVMGTANVRDPNATTVKGTSKVIHSGWNPITLANDIALLKIPEVNLTDSIQTIALVTTDPSIGTVVTATGWGKVSDSAQGIASTLQSVNMPVISNTACNLIYGIIRDSNICTDTAGGKSTCNGDSGGPLVTKSNKLAGITSFGASAGCSEGYPAVFTRASYYSGWITENAV